LAGDSARSLHLNSTVNCVCDHEDSSLRRQNCEMHRSNFKSIAVLPFIVSSISIAIMANKQLEHEQINSVSAVAKTANTKASLSMNTYRLFAAHGIRWTFRFKAMHGTPLTCASCVCIVVTMHISVRSWRLRSLTLVERYKV
jgi:hypothetical protein